MSVRRLAVAVAVVGTLTGGCMTTKTRVVDREEVAGATGAAGAKVPDVGWIEHEVGDAVVTGRGNTVKVHAVEHDRLGAAAARFAHADVEACAAATAPPPIAIRPSFFLLEADDQTTRAATSTGGIKEPALRDSLITPGDCVRGWISFALVEDDEPAAVLLATSSFVRWHLDLDGQD